ncbi:hypothetical protein H9P43_004447 [Blastocladiella emersonii ATCC 22665]|nr:hypothetical protein H9P43_004447 [Blastocladiella emersonii ATCC 22665]
MPLSQIACCTTFASRRRPTRRVSSEPPISLSRVAPAASATSSSNPNASAADLTDKRLAAASSASSSSAHHHHHSSSSSATFVDRQPTTFPRTAAHLHVHPAPPEPAASRDHPVIGFRFAPHAADDLDLPSIHIITPTPTESHHHHPLGLSPPPFTSSIAAATEPEKSDPMPDFLTVRASSPGPNASAGAGIQRSGTPMPTAVDPAPFAVSSLGYPTYPTTLDTHTTFTQDGDVLLYKPFFVAPDSAAADTHSISSAAHATELPQQLPGHIAPVPLFFERAGPRKELFYNPRKVTAGIVTCGGLCPGLNNVIRALVQCLYYRYRVQRVVGFRYGYEGLNPAVGMKPVDLTPAEVKDVHRFGGCMLGSSRGPQDPKVMVDYLEDLGVDMLFTIGGDGTQKGAHAIAKEIAARGLQISVIGIGKTIDNDIAYQKAFGFETAVAMSLDPIQAAHEEARSARGGIGIVKLMGRDSGFIALHAALASGDVNLLLLPEVPFTLDVVYRLVEDRLRTRDHIVIVVAEGAGQDLVAAELAAQAPAGKDASGNTKLLDIGVFLKDKLGAHLKQHKIEHTIKYIDPSYTIRSAPACATDAVFTVSLAQQAVHAAMAGKTDSIIGLVQDEFVLIPIAKAVERRKKVDPDSPLYQTLLDHTGMPRDLTK